MKTIEFTALDAKKLLGKSKEVDEFIREKFTKSDLELTIIDHVKTFEDAFMIKTGHSYAYAGEPYEKHRMPHEIARIKLEVICSVLNEGWRPNFLNKDEYKFYPLFKVCSRGNSSEGLVFAITVHAPADAFAMIGARLCFKTQELAEYAGKQFVNLYEIMLLG